MKIKNYQSLWDKEFVCDLSFQIKATKVIVTIAELQEEKAQSLAAAYELVATEVYRRFLYETPLKDIIWLEHCPALPLRPESFRRVFMYWNAECFTNARRRRLKEKRVSRDRLEVEMDTVQEAMACYGTSLWNKTYLVNSLEKLLAIL